MQQMNSSTLLVYGLASATLCAQLLLLWAGSGLARSKTKTALNAEDAAQFGGTLVDKDPPVVARVLRVHANGQATVYPFLVLGLVYVLLGGGAVLAVWLFAIFVVARLLHTLAYLREMQPWRTIFFLMGMATTVVLLGTDVWLAFRSI